MSVIVNNLTKTYGVQNAIDSISFKAEKGEIVGFLGPNGAGKSTTMKIATCYVPPTSGTVIVAGYNVVENSMDVRKVVGYLPEHNPLYLDMYVHEYLTLAGSLYGISSSNLSSRVKEMVSVCGLTLEQNKKIGALSKGYRQRVGLAQALIHDPKVLILDEPTTGLDPNQILEIRNLIKDISREKTIIFSTHIMQEVQAICDRVVIINRGKIAADSKVSELQKFGANEIIITVELENEIDITQLKEIDGVIEANQEGKGIYKLRANNEKDVRASIFRKAADNQWTLVGLKQEERSIENIFRELTGNKKSEL